MYKEGDRLVTGHRLIQFLGRGNFGEVWKATAPGNTFTALKFLNLEQTQGRSEYRAIQPLKNIRHANLLQMTAIWLLDENGQIIPDDEVMEGMFMDTVRGTLASVTVAPTDHRPSTLIIAMPYADRNLDQLLQDYKEKGLAGIPREELLDYLEDAAKAIDYLNAPHHDLGQGPMAIRHCDVKPENLLLMGQSVVLCDFGVSRSILGSSTARKTSLGGSLAYMAPECLSDEVTEYSDQFSLAISYLELRTGKLPFDGMSQAAVMEQRRRGILDLRDLPKAEAAVIRRATSVNPAHRYSSALKLVEALQQAKEGKSGSPLKVMAISAAVLLAASAGGLAWWQYGSAPAPEPEPPPVSLGGSGEPVEEKQPPLIKEWIELETQAYTAVDSDWNRAVELMSQAIQKRSAEEPLKFPSAVELVDPNNRFFSQPFWPQELDRLVTLDKSAEGLLTLATFEGERKMPSTSSTIAMESISKLGQVDDQVIVLGQNGDSQMEVVSMLDTENLPAAWKPFSRGPNLGICTSAHGKKSALLEWKKRMLIASDGNSLPLEIEELDPDDPPLCQLSDDGKWVAFQATSAVYIGRIADKKWVRLPLADSSEIGEIDLIPGIFSFQVGRRFGFITLSRKIDFKGNICVLKFQLDDPEQFEFLVFQPPEKDAYYARLEKQNEQIHLLLGVKGEEVLMYRDIEQGLTNFSTFAPAESVTDVGQRAEAIAYSFTLDVGLGEPSWLAWGTNRNQLYLQKLDQSEPPISIAETPFEPAYVYLDETRLLIGSDRCAVANYNFREIKLIYEASKKAGKLSTVQPSKPLPKTKA